jgi:hypothetical protein
MDVKDSKLAKLASPSSPLKEASEPQNISLPQALPGKWVRVNLCLKPGSGAHWREGDSRLKLSRRPRG